MCKYHIAGANGAKPINNVNDDETGAGASIQNQRFLIHCNLLLHLIQCRFITRHIDTTLEEIENPRVQRFQKFWILGQIRGGNLKQLVSDVLNIKRRRIFF